MKAWPVVLAAALPLAALATHPQLPAAAVPSTSKPTAMLLQPGDIKWQETPDLPGIQVAVLVGDPGKAGSHLIMRARFPDGFKIPPHWHPQVESFAVLQGTFMLGMGDKWDDSKLVGLSTGAFASIPKGQRHFATAKGETILELSAIGPFKTNWVEPPKK